MQPARLNHGEIENLNRPTMNKENESIITNLPIQRNPGPESFMDELGQIVNELMHILLKLFQ